MDKNSLRGKFRAAISSGDVVDRRTENHSAIAFWEKHGYRTRGVWKGYYPGGRDAYAMIKSFE